MPKIYVNFKELDLLDRKLKLLAKETNGICKMAIFDGADIAITAVKKQINELDRVPDVVAINCWKKSSPCLISVSQKNGLRESIGISRMKVKGKIISNRVGFDGYNDVKTRRWPNGQPNVMIAASCEHGSSAMLEQPFIRTAYYLSKSAVQRAMVKTATDQITKILDK